MTVLATNEPITSEMPAISYSDDGHRLWMENIERLAGFGASVTLHLVGGDLIDAQVTGVGRDDTDGFPGVWVQPVNDSDMPVGEPRFYRSDAFTNLYVY